MSLRYLSPVLILVCSCVSPPKPDLCGLVLDNGRMYAECLPTNPEKESYFLELNDMLGFTCLSPRDRGEVKKYLKYVAEKLDQ